VPNAERIFFIRHAPRARRKVFVFTIWFWLSSFVHSLQFEVFSGEVSAESWKEQFNHGCTQIQAKCLTDALTGDYHFEQAGFVALLE
jgi:hypothetical protein